MKDYDKIGILLLNSLDVIEDLKRRLARYSVNYEITEIDSESYLIIDFIDYFRRIRKSWLEKNIIIKEFEYSIVLLRNNNIIDRGSIYSIIYDKPSTSIFNPSITQLMVPYNNFYYTSIYGITSSYFDVFSNPDNLESNYLEGLKEGLFRGFLKENPEFESYIIKIFTDYKIIS